MKKPIIAEQTVDYIRANTENLALRFPGLFLVFHGTDILGKYKKNWEAQAFVKTLSLEGVIIWGFDPLPIQTGLRLMTDKEQSKKRRARELARLRQKRYYDNNKKKERLRKAIERAKNPERNRKAVKAWYYKDHAKTLQKKKAWTMGVVCTKKLCTV